MIHIARLVHFAMHPNHTEGSRPRLPSLEWSALYFGVGFAIGIAAIRFLG